jgi:hypothetical protein
VCAGLEAARIGDAGQTQLGLLRKMIAAVIDCTSIALNHATPPASRAQ